MRRFLKNGIRFLLVTVGIVALTSFTIDATDALRGSQSALSMLAGSALEEGCPEGTVQIDLATKSICVDAYENGVGEGCGIRQPSVVLETKANIEMSECYSVSQAEVVPWTHVSYHQAKTLCAKKDMRLPSALEWYEAALGTPDTDACNIDGALTQTGAFSGCQSARGVYDAIGNVWEWIDGQVQNGSYDGRVVPESGYVAAADTAGIATETSSSESELYNSDYFWSTTEGVRAIMRGGFYDSGEDAGVYTSHMQVEPSFAGVATGFRCVKDM